MIQLFIFWGYVIDIKLWSIYTSYANYIYNHIINVQNIISADLFTGTNFTHHKIKDHHMLGCLVYILEPTLQQGRELSKWKPQSCHRICYWYICWV